MISDQGVYHFYSTEGEKEVRGNLVDNSYMLLAFVEGFEAFQDDSFLKTAEKIADYSLENLYDWNSGGFFERNSPDKELYALGDNINLKKTSQENSIMIYSFLKLYSETNENDYLNAALKSYGNQLGSIGGLDFSYYFIKSAQYILDNNLLSEYDQGQSNQKEVEKQSNFWLNEVIAEPLVFERNTNFQVSDEGLETFQGPIFILLLISLLAGVLSFASPCTLPILPAYLAFTFRSSKKNIIGMTSAFFLGLVIIFTILGMTASVFGGFLRDNLLIFSYVAGALIVLFGIFMIVGKGIPGLKIKHKDPRSYVGSFMFGSALGIAWTPCVGPILVGILAFASISASFLTGGLMLLLYGIGLAAPLVFFSIFLGRIDKESKIWKFIRGKQINFKIGNKIFSVHSTSLFSGLIFIILGILIFTGLLFTFNQYIGTSSFQIWIYGLEDKLLNLFS